MLGSVATMLGTYLAIVTCRRRPPTAVAMIQRELERNSRASDVARVHNDRWAQKLISLHCERVALQGNVYKMKKGVPQKEVPQKEVPSPWCAPCESTRMSSRTTTDAEASATLPTMKAIPSTALPTGWSRYTTDEGMEYFHHAATNTTQWHTPHWPESFPRTADVTALTSLGASTADASDAELATDAVSAATMPGDDMGPRILTAQLHDPAIKVVYRLPDPGAGMRVEMAQPRISERAVLPQWASAAQLHNDIRQRRLITGEYTPNAICDCPYCL